MISITNDSGIWYSYKGGSYAGSQPAFFDPINFTWLDQTAAKFPFWKAEIESYIQHHEENLQQYFNNELSSKKSAWKVEPFYSWGIRNDISCNKCPNLDAFFKTIPGLTSAAISWLDAGTEIYPHHGDTNAIIRAHLGIFIPAQIPDCGIQVKDETRSWQEGQWLLFCDAHKHRAWNNTTLPRCVLIVDILLPTFKNKQAEIFKNVRSLHALQQLEKRHPVIKKLPSKIRGIIRHLLKSK